ncbi:MAG: hypothetical protein ACKPJJ_00530, partial [Planctomycetaceae bacterium]
KNIFAYKHNPTNPMSHKQPTNRTTQLNLVSTTDPGTGCNRWHKSEPSHIQYYKAIPWRVAGNLW